MPLALFLSLSRSSFHLLLGFPSALAETLISPAVFEATCRAGSVRWVVSYVVRCFLLSDRKFLLAQLAVRVACALV